MIKERCKNHSLPCVLPFTGKFLFEIGYSVSAAAIYINDLGQDHHQWQGHLQAVSC